MGRDDRKASEDRAPDLEIEASARMDDLRMKEKSDVAVRFRGRSVQRTSTESERQNLPRELEPGKEYRDARIAWRAGAFVDDSLGRRPPDPRADHD